MPSADDRRPKGRRMNASLILKAAFPGSAIKSIANGVGCSLSQAERISKTGRIPQRLRESVLRLVEDALARRQVELGIVSEQLRQIAAEEMSARAAERRASAGIGNSDAAVAAQDAEQTTLPLLKE